MIFTYSTHFSRTILRCLGTLTSDDLLKSTNNKNTVHLAKDLVALSLDHSAGTPQHKTALVSSMISHRFSTQEIYGTYKEFHAPNNTRFHFEPNGTQDVRAMSELAVVHALQKAYGNDLAWTIATADLRAGNFLNQKQSNQDFWCMVNLQENPTKELAFKCVPHDSKSGIEMLKHSSRGTLGMLCYDSQTGENVQILDKSIPYYDLVNNVNKANLPMLAQTCKTDGTIVRFAGILRDAGGILNKKGNPRDIHKEYQDFLWNNLQKDPQFTRSISLIFTENVHYAPLEGKLRAFHDKFIEGLGTKRLYNLDRVEDSRLVLNVMLKAYRDTIDPKIVDKLHALHHKGGIGFNDDFLIL